MFVLILGLKRNLLLSHNNYLSFPKNLVKPLVCWFWNGHTNKWHAIFFAFLKMTGHLWMTEWVAFLSGLCYFERGNPTLEFWAIQTVLALNSLNQVCLLYGRISGYALWILIVAHSPTNLRLLWFDIFFSFLDMLLK